MLPLSEFELIQRYFAPSSISRPDVLLGVGDDAALLDARGAGALALCMDTMVAGVHFPADAPADSVGHKVLAVNLSDLAAMGAQPAWALLSLTLPCVDEAWIAAFSRGFRSLAESAGVALVGGDTTRGPLAATITAAGWVEANRALRRAAAKPGDHIYVTGTLGDAAMGLRLWQGGQRTISEHAQWLVDRLHRPAPRLRAGFGLLGIANAAIDISDGLCADLGHILEQSGVGATIDSRVLPLSAALVGECKNEDPRRFALSGGDDYELCFTVSPSAEQALADVVVELGVPITRIGRIEAELGLRILGDDGRLVVVEHLGFDHFRNNAS